MWLRFSVSVVVLEAYRIVDLFSVQCLIFGASLLKQSAKILQKVCVSSISQSDFYLPTTALCILKKSFVFYHLSSISWKFLSPSLKCLPVLSLGYVVRYHLIDFIFFRFSFTLLPILSYWLVHKRNNVPILVYLQS